MCRAREILFFLILFLSLPLIVSGQSQNKNISYEMDVETFMGLLDGIYSDSLIDEITYLLPEKLKICNFTVGDFSGDNLNDIIISYRDNTCPKNALKVIFLQNNTTNFIKVSEKTLKWINTPFDISFTIKNLKCYVSHRLGQKWVFSCYFYKYDTLRLLSEERY